MPATSKAPLPTPGCCAANNPTSSTAKWRALFQPAPLPPKSFRRKPKSSTTRTVWTRQPTPKSPSSSTSWACTSSATVNTSAKNSSATASPPAGLPTPTTHSPPPPEFHFRKTKKECAVLGTLSRLDTVRAVHLMLDILKKMVDRGMPVRLNVAGIGEEMDNLKAQAKRLGIEDKVTFLGGVRDLTGYFKEVDILVNTPHCVGDHGAGVGNNILEAGLYDTPVVTYNMAGISEMVITGQTGYCIPFGDDEAFIEAVDTLIKHPELRSQMGKALHKHVETLCSDDEIYRTTMAAYEM
uniref:Glycosyl transferase, group 1 family protein n=1 Tax=Neisseria meningitidis alpha153 TaxID=663926 RepID=C6SBD9_NEIME|nr:glycosyl transferase, group 1 family protein [Neisseria meningitidis alpha153]